MLTQCLYTEPSPTGPIPCPWRAAARWYDLPLCWDHHPESRKLRRSPARRAEVRTRLAELIRQAYETHRETRGADRRDRSRTV